ncbi:InlB B-repeat-containing protein, partial [Methanobacterium sp. YSL]|nr:InlB B-repeat-containing protein [Methanobacterium sp. YSL]
IYVFDKMPAEDITLYAKWSINAYTITFDSNGGSAVNSITQDYNTSVIAPANPTKLGYTFGGWYSDSGLTTVYVFDKMPAQSITLYAKWSINAYTITLDSNDGSAVNPITQDYNTSVVAPANPTKLGYTFDGWYSDSSLTTIYVFDKMPAEDITLYAKWSMNAYTISFEVNGGSAVDSITQNYDTDVTAPLNPTKLGYTFGGWYSDSSLTTVYVFDKMPAEDITLYAKWALNAYTISFEVNGGSAVNSITQNYDTNVTAPVNPTKLGYTFGGWYSDSALTVLYTFSTMPAQSITLYAKWSLNAYTISFEVNGGSAVNSITQDYNTSVIAPANPTKLGYTFGGWYSDSGLTTVYVFDKMPAQSITLYAKWSINTYTITFDSKGGTAVDSIQLEYGSTIVLPVNPTKSGFIFNGWNQSVPSTMPAENLNLYAYWLKITQPTNENGQTDTNALLNAIDESLMAQRDMEVSIVFERTPISTVTQDVVRSIESMLTQNQKYSILDIRIVLKAEGQADVIVEELNDKIVITLMLEKSEQGHKNYQIVRIHDGQTEVLESTYDDLDHSITFETDQFSNYVIIYETATTSWAWWLLLLLLPVGVGLFIYRKPLIGIFKKD